MASSTCGTRGSGPASACRSRSSRSTATTWSGLPSRAEPRTPRTGADHLARWVATAGGLGYVPVAPGSAASLPVALLVWWLAPSPLALLGAVAATTLAGLWAAGREEARLGEKDPGAIVVDEVAGMLVACLGHPRTLPWVLGLFLLFRVFDVWKPLGIDRLQALPGGTGVMADDLLAGVLASLVAQARHLV